MPILNIIWSESLSVVLLPCHQGLNWAVYLHIKRELSIPLLFHYQISSLIFLSTIPTLDISDWHSFTEDHFHVTRWQSSQGALPEEGCCVFSHALTTPEESRVCSPLGPLETRMMALQYLQRHPALPHHIPKSCCFFFSFPICPLLSCAFQQQMHKQAGEQGDIIVKQQTYITR